MAAQSIIIPTAFLEDDAVRDLSLYNQVEKLKESIDPETKSDILASYTYYIAILNRYNPAYFKFMGQAEREQLYFDLQIAYLLLIAKIQQELKYKKHENLAALEKQQEYCQKALSRVYQLLNDQPVILDSYQDSPTNYVYLKLGQWLGEKIDEAGNGKTKFIQYWIAQLNDRRLYWVWGGCLLETVFQAYVPDDFYHTASAKKEVAALHPVMGYLSFVLYYFRFGLNLFLLLKHTIKNPWMSEEESLTPWTERVKTQWNQRKFMLINDSVWATANLVGFFWLVGSTVKDNSNNLLTVGLLILDLSLAIWSYWEAETEYRKDLEVLNDSARQLKIDIEHAGAIAMRSAANAEQQSEIDKAKIQLGKLKLQKKNLTSDIAKMQSDWKFKKLSLLTDIGYALGLMLCFALMTIPFIPVAAPLALTLGVVGIAACFVLTSVYSAISAGIEISKENTNRKAVNGEIKQLGEKWETITDENQKKQLYLQIQDLQAEHDHAKKVIRYQSLNLLRAVMIDAMMPALVFAATVFMPMGIGIAVIAVAIGIALLSKLLLKLFAEPQAGALVKAEFNAPEFNDFSEDMDSNNYNPRLFARGRHGSKISDQASVESTTPEYEPRLFTG